MTFGELLRLINTMPLAAHDEPVMVTMGVGAETVELLSLQGIEYEPPTYDEGGNATSLSGTVWVRTEAY